MPSEVDLTSETKDSVLTKVLGHPHSDESKAKISAANKGKTPWNYGRQHSEETRKRIAEKTRESILKRKLEKANELGITIEEMENAKKVAEFMSYSQYFLKYGKPRGKIGS